MYLKYLLFMLEELNLYDEFIGYLENKKNTIN